MKASSASSHHQPAQASSPKAAGMLSMAESRIIPMRGVFAS